MFSTRGNIINETVQLSDAYSKYDQESGAWVPADDKRLATSDAIAARHDAYIVQSNLTNLPTNNLVSLGRTPKSATAPTGNGEGNDSKTWVAYVNTGPRGIPDKTAPMVLTVRKVLRVLLVPRVTKVMVLCDWLH